MHPSESVPRRFPSWGNQGSWQSFLRLRCRDEKRVQLLHRRSHGRCLTGSAQIRFNREEEESLEKWGICCARVRSLKHC